ncbi:MAG TPA: response regulator [Bryobacteraceae bacterium]|jgi:DNA-binding response OmpR family regulator|nr:response regulator [Bryobacteraceae bacterium]
MARLLLVDDDSAGLELRKLILEREGHQVSAAADVVAARSLFLENRPDSVVLDLRLPESEDGLALIREFRVAAPDLRIIVLSGWTPDLEGKPEARMVDELLAKPLRSARLVSAVAAGASGATPK